MTASAEFDLDPTADGRPRLRARLAEPPRTLEGEERPEPGPISLLPADARQVFADAVRAGGGELVELSEATRGLVFLDYTRPQLLAEALDAHPDISWVQLPYAGIDAMAELVAPHAERGVVFTSAKGAYAEPVAEHALALLLGMMRNLPLRARADAWGPGLGRSLYGTKVIIVGAGGIARELLALLAPFRVEATVVRRSPEPVEGAARTVTIEELDELLPDADAVILAAAATSETRALLDRRRIGLLPRRAVVVNIARGPLVDTEALADALDAGALYGAGLDVTDPEPLPDGHRLFSNDRAIITPHSADTIQMTDPLLAERIRANVRGFLETGEFTGLADPRKGY